MSISVQAIEKRGAVRSKVKELLQAGPAALSDLQILFSREEPDRHASGFINIYFLTGEVSQARGLRDDEGLLVVRIGKRSAGDVDAELDELAKLVVQQLGEPVGRLDGTVDSIQESRWEYGAPEQATVNFLGLIYNVKYSI